MRAPAAPSTRPYPRVVLGLLALAATVAFPAVAGAARPGQLDSSFGSSGITTLRPDSRLLDVAVDRSGKAVVVGEVGKGANRVRLLVQRLDARGRPDPRFNRGRPYLGPVGTIAHSVVIQRDGKIVVAGTDTDRTGTDQRGMLVMRLTSSGTRDRSFSRDGKAVLLARFRGQGLAVALAGRKIVVAGSATLLRPLADDFDRVAVARLQPSGRLDRSFGRRGIQVLNSGRLSLANDVAVQRGGKIVVAGSQRHDLQRTKLLATRLRPDGRLDRGFGLFVRQYARGASYSAAESLVLAPGGKVILAGTALSQRVGPMALAVRLNAGGSPDRGFGGDGAVYLPASRSHNQYSFSPYAGAAGVVLSGPDIVLVGSHDDFGQSELAVWGLRANGSLDGGFGTNGRTFTDVNGLWTPLSAATDSRGRIVAVGEKYRPAERHRGIAVRYGGR